MVREIVNLLKTTEISSKDIDRARGRYKLPENWKEIKRYLKFRWQNRQEL